MDAFLSKPFRQAELREAMQEATSKRYVAPVPHRKALGAER